MTVEELHVVRLGQRALPPMIVLHGWGHSLETIRPLAELLSDAADVHLVDLPGHGRSRTPESVWGMEDFARCLLDYLDRQGIERADFVGHSFGGKTSMKFAALFPERLGRLVLINSSGLKPERPLKKRIKFMLIGWLRNFIKKIDRWFNLKWFESWFIPKFASPDYLNAGPLLKTFVKTVNEDLSEDISRIRQPTLLLWGELDTETPLEMVARLQKLMPHAEAVVLKGKGHVPFLDAGAHLCMFHIKPFLERHPLAPPSVRGVEHA